MTVVLWFLLVLPTDGSPGDVLGEFATEEACVSLATTLRSEHLACVEYEVRVDPGVWS